MKKSWITIRLYRESQFCIAGINRFVPLLLLFLQRKEGEDENLMDWWSSSYILKSSKVLPFPHPSAIITDRTNDVSFFPNRILCRHVHLEVRLDLVFEMKKQWVWFSVFWHAKCWCDVEASPQMLLLAWNRFLKIDLCEMKAFKSANGSRSFKSNDFHLHNRARTKVLPHYYWRYSHVDKGYWMSRELFILFIRRGLFRYLRLKAACVTEGHLSCQMVLLWSS